MSTPDVIIGIAARGLDTSKLADRRPHGDRVKYIGGCRCDRCREANTLYERARQQARARGDWNGMAPAEPARAHLLALSEQGIGQHTVAHATGVSRTVIGDIVSGTKKRIRARTSRRILAVTTDARADGSLVSAAPTWKRIRALYAQGFTEADIATRLGYARPYLQVGKRQVLAITELQIERLHVQLDGTLRPARQTRAWFAELIEEGFTAATLAAKLDMDAAALDAALNGRPAHVSAAFEQGMERLYRRLTS